MRWDGLFADLEAQAGALAQAERASEVDEQTRGEVARLAVGDRVRAAVGAAVRVGVRGGSPVCGDLLRVGPDWLLLLEAGGQEALIAQAGVVAIGGLGRHSASPGAVSAVDSRLGLRHALRGIARDRASVRIQLVDGSVVAGTVDRVGADFVEVATHPVGEPRRRAAVREVLVLPLPAVVVVRRRDGSSG